MNDRFDPELVTAATELRRMGLLGPPPETVPLSDARATADALDAHLNQLEAPVGREFELMVNGPHGPIRSMVCSSGKAGPTLLYFHGGGWTLGSARGWTGVARRLVSLAGATVILVDDQLAPEAPYPVAVDEARHMLDLLMGGSLLPEIDVGRVAVGGDSAGANLALVAATTVPRRRPFPALLLLFYGVYSTTMASPSWKRFGDGRTGLSRATMEWIWRNYLGKSEPAHDDPSVAPLHAALAGLPATHLSVGSLDPLLDDSRMLHERLTAAGVPSKLLVWSGLNHGYVRLHGLAPMAERALNAAAESLRGL